MEPESSPIMKNPHAATRFQTFSRLAREATLVPVVKSVSADLLTPVLPFWRLRRRNLMRFCWNRLSGANRSGAYLSGSAAVHASEGARREK